MTPSIHDSIMEAFEAHWVILVALGHQTEFLKPMMERHLNEVLDHAIIASPEFQGFYPFPVRIRVIHDKKNGVLVWGFVQIGEDEALDWIKTVRGSSFDDHFPSNRWINLSIPRVSRSEILISLSRALRVLRQGEEDTLDTLLRVGVHNHLEDRKVVALARLVDASGV